MTLAEQIELACLLEATARKPGNVHPGAAFDDLCYDDFLKAAAASAPVLARTHKLGIGRAIFEAVAVTRAVAPSNVNLGICLLLAPLAVGAASGSLWDGARAALAASTVDDTENIYRAIRLANPGGLGRALEQDASETPTLTIPQVMALAADRDDIARDLATGFRRLETEIAPLLESAISSRHTPCAVPALDALHKNGTRSVPATIEMPDWERAIVLTHLRLISEGDTLIRRKCGESICREAADRAARLLKHWEATGSLDEAALAAFDRWLRADGHRRNPGTSADLIAAAVFAVLAQDHSTRRQFASRSDLLSHLSRTGDRL